VSGTRVIAGAPPAGEPDVGVIVPAYQAEATIARTLESLRTQTLERWHAVVVDDGSRDRTVEIARWFAGRDARLMVIAKPNGGVSSARNAGLDVVRGRYVHHLDSDDWLAPKAYERMVSAADAAGTGACVSSFDVTDERGRVIYEHRHAMDRVGLDELFDRVQVWTGAHLVRRDHAVRVRFDESLVGYEDQDAWSRLAERGVVWAGLGDVVAFHRIRGGSLTRRRREMAECGQRVLARVWSRQEGRPEGERMLDLAPGRLERAQGRLALAYATGEAVEGRIDAAAALLASAGGRKRFGSAEVADAGRFAVVYGLGVRPALGGAGSGAWLGPLLAWWGRMVDEGWAAEGLTPRAGMRLAMQTLDPDVVCDAILDGAPSGAELVVVGCGTNGRRLVGRAVDRGVRVRVRDDRFEAAGSASFGEVPAAAEVERMGDRIRPGDWVVVTPARDASLVRRLGRGRVDARWREVVRRLALGGAPAGLRRSA
jgi:hypothetical protein